MSITNGQLVACERCGATIFLRCIGEGERDGGFTLWNKFEPLPKGWNRIQIPSNDYKYDSLQVCPACHDLWRKVLVENFLPKKEGEQ